VRRAAWVLLLGAAMTARGVGPALPPVPPPPPDSLAENELHHPSAFRDEALRATAGATTTMDRARAIFRHVYLHYRYDDSDPEIVAFTWSDVLVRRRGGGACDELSVVAVSLLRALGIPARLMLMTVADSTIVHTFAEFRDEGGVWHMLDPVCAFDDPTVYRNVYSLRGIRIMEATDPDDRRSNADTFGFPDPPGDGKLNPYRDFVLVPPFPGQPRAPYSDVSPPSGP
jgi:hypothetical protein